MKRSQELAYRGVQNAGISSVRCCCFRRMFVAEFEVLNSLILLGFWSEVIFKNVEFIQVKFACNGEEKGYKHEEFTLVCALGTDLFWLSVVVFSWCFASIWHVKWESWLVLGCPNCMSSHCVSKGMFRCQKMSLIKCLIDVCAKLWFRLSVNMEWISGILRLVKCQAFAK